MKVALKVTKGTTIFVKKGVDLSRNLEGVSKEVLKRDFFFLTEEVMINPQDGTFFDPEVFPRDGSIKGFLAQLGWYGFKYRGYLVLVHQSKVKGILVSNGFRM